MPKMQLTYWICPRCGEETTIDACELAEIGTPFCSGCMADGVLEPEMEPKDLQDDQ